MSGFDSWLAANNWDPFVAMVMVLCLCVIAAGFALDVGMRR
jgi:hypothetical protein